MTKGRAGTVTSDYKRRGTTTLFAAINAVDGTVIGSCMDKHRHKEFLKFLRTVDREVPKGLAVHMILDSYATHKHKDVVAWLAKHPRFQLHFTQTSSSWLNLVERWFRELTGKALTPGRVPQRSRAHHRDREIHAGPQHRAQSLRLDRHRRILPDQSPVRPSRPQPNSQSMTRHTTSPFGLRRVGAARDHQHNNAASGKHHPLSGFIGDNSWRRSSAAACCWAIVL